MDLLKLDRQALDLNIDLIAGLTAEQLNMATPCAGWTVHDLLQHQVDSTLAFAAMARVQPSGVSHPIGDDPLGAYRAAAEQTTEAFHANGLLAREIEFTGYGIQRGSTVVAAHFIDNLVHAWDLAKAIGIDSALDTEAAEAAYRIARKYPNDPNVRGPDAAFGRPVPVPDTAPITDRLVALLGRSPSWPA